MVVHVRVVFVCVRDRSAAGPTLSLGHRRHVRSSLPWAVTLVQGYWALKEEGFWHLNIYIVAFLIQNDYFKTNVQSEHLNKFTIWKLNIMQLLGRKRIACQPQNK